MNRNMAFDSIRWLMAVVIVMYHVFVNFYNNMPSMRYFSGGYLAVEGFFIISGFLLMKSFYSYQQRYTSFSVYQKLKAFSWARIKRLYPEFFFIFIITVIIRSFLHQSTPWGLWLPNLLMLGNFCGIPGIVRDVWFISSMFWISIFLFGMMLFYDKKFYCFFFPFMILSCYLFMINVPRTLTIHSSPIYFGMISGGAFRSFLGIGIGCMAYLCKDFIQRFPDFIVRIIEISCILYCMYLMFHGNLNMETFNFYFSFSIIIIILYNRRETFLKFLSSKIFNKISFSSYMLFLSHLIIIENLSQYFKIYVYKFNPLLIMITITSLSICTGYILYVIFNVIKEKMSHFIHI